MNLHLWLERPKVMQKNLRFVRDRAAGAGGDSLCVSIKSKSSQVSHGHVTLRDPLSRIRSRKM